jgi:D-alanyl-D-alanine carboxypeptidase/D-alanyl-D-alanine-endopeptidase (penicillin-binding protein 4)
MMKERNNQYTMFNAQFSVIKVQIIVISLALLFAGCSVSKQLARSADRMVLQDSALVNAHVGISIFDPSTGKYLYDYNGDKYFVPASNTKIPTCYAVMKFLGDSLAGLHYHEESDRILIKGSGDPTFLVKEFKRQPVYDFLKSVNKKLEMDFSNWRAEKLGSGWAWNDYLQTYMAHRSAMPLYGNIFSVKLENGKLQFTPEYFYTETGTSDINYTSGFTVTREPYSNLLDIKTGTRKTAELTFHPDIPTIFELLEDTLHKKLYSVLSNPGKQTNRIIYSQATDSVFKPMMHRSDNFFAEQLLLMVSDRAFGFMSDSRIIDSILKTTLKDLPQPPRWVDGSGLSRYNLFSPRDFVTILNKMKEEFGMERIKTILPTGNEGTLAGLYIKDSGTIFAKTGTLSGVVALSGFVYTNKNKILIFSMLVNNHRGSATAVRKAYQKFIQDIRAKY